MEESLRSSVKRSSVQRQPEYETVIKYSVTQFYNNKEELVKHVKSRKKTQVFNKSQLSGVVNKIMEMEPEQFLKSNESVNLHVQIQKQNTLEKTLEKESQPEKEEKEVETPSKVYMLQNMKISKIRDILRYKQEKSIPICGKCSYESDLMIMKYLTLEMPMEDDDELGIMNLNYQSKRIDSLMEDQKREEQENKVYEKSKLKLKNKKDKLKEQFQNKIKNIAKNFQDAIEHLQINKLNIFEENQKISGQKQQNSLSLVSNDVVLNESMVIEISSDHIDQYLDKIYESPMNYFILNNYQTLNIEQMKIFSEIDTFSNMEEKEMLKIEDKYIVKCFCVVQQSNKNIVLMGTIDGQLLHYNGNSMSKIDIQNEEKNQIEKIISCQNIRNATKFAEYVVLNDIVGNIYLVDINKQKLRKKYQNIRQNISRLSIFSNTDLRFIFMHNEGITIMRIQRYQLYSLDTDKYKVNNEDFEGSVNAVNQSITLPENRSSVEQSQESIDSSFLQRSLSEKFFILKNFELLLMKTNKKQKHRPLVKNKLIALIGSHKIMFGLIKPKYKTLKLKLQLRNNKMVLNNQINFVQDVGALDNMQVKFVFIDNDFELNVYQLQFFEMLDDYSNSSSYELHRILKLQIIHIGKTQIDRIYFKNSNQMFIKSSMELLQTKISTSNKYLSSHKINSSDISLVIGDNPFQEQIYVITNNCLIQYSNRKHEPYLQHLISNQQYELLLDHFFYQDNIQMSEQLKQNDYKNFIQKTINQYLQLMKDDISFERIIQVIQILIQNEMSEYLYQNLYDQFKKYQNVQQFYKAIQQLTQNKVIRYIAIEQLQKIVDELNIDEQNIEIIETLLINLDIEKYQVEEFLELAMTKNLIKAIIIISNKYKQDFNTPLIKMLGLYKEDRQIGKLIIQYFKCLVIQRYIDGFKIDNEIYSVFIRELFKWLNQSEYFTLFFKIDRQGLLGIIYKLIKSNNKQMADAIANLINKITKEEEKVDSKVYFEANNNQIDLDSEYMFMFYLFILFNKVVVQYEELQITVAIKMLYIYSHNQTKVKETMKQLSIKNMQISQLYINSVIDKSLDQQQMNDLVKYADMVNLNYLCSELHFKKNKFINSIESLLECKDLDTRNMVFQQIERIFQYCQDQHKYNDFNKQTVKNMQSEFLKFFYSKLEQLIQMSPQQTYRIIQKYQKEKQNDFIQSLNNNKECQIQLVKIQIEDYKKDPLVVDSKVLDIYFRLLAEQKAQEQLIQDLEIFFCCQNFSPNNCIEYFKENQLNLALSYIYEKVGDNVQAITLLFELIEEYFNQILRLQKPFLEEYFKNIKESKNLDIELQTSQIKEDNILKKIEKIFLIFKRILEICEASELIAQSQWDNAYLLLRSLNRFWTYHQLENRAEFDPKQQNEPINLLMKVVINKLYNKYFLKLEQTLRFKDFIEKIRGDQFDIHFDQCKDSFTLIYNNIQFNSIIQKNMIDILQKELIQSKKSLSIIEHKGKLLEYHCVECEESLNRETSYLITFQCGHFIHLNCFNFGDKCKICNHSNTVNVTNSDFFIKQQKMNLKKNFKRFQQIEKNKKTVGIKLEEKLEQCKKKQQMEQERERKKVENKKQIAIKQLEKFDEQK